tara:strand:+ start:830 stop:1477 length:648 start_codon:yes stop_codon:yes gene_type:complete
MELPIQYIHAILDRSGSMSGKISDVVGGFRTNIHNLKDEEFFDIYVSAKMFDHEQDTIIPNTNVKEFTDECFDEAMKNYVPRGQTALRDALGDSINYFITMYDMSTVKYQSCMIYVMTDGLENASRNPNYTSDKLGLLIKKAENYNIKVFYIGANQDAILNASNIGISENQAINYTENTQNVESVFRSLSSVAHRIRSNQDVGFNENERLTSVES